MARLLKLDPIKVEIGWKFEYSFLKESTGILITVIYYL